jgi:hypothetical protein
MPEAPPATTTTLPANPRSAMDGKTICPGSPT